MSDTNGAPPKVHYDCSRCPAYCCTYARIDVTKRDIARLARHFGLDFETAKTRFTKFKEGGQVLRHKKDHIFESSCIFLDSQTRRCTIYNARPGVCHTYPEMPRCGYYEFLKWERQFQDDPDFIPLTRE